MNLEQAIIVIEDGAARMELANKMIPGKNKEARIRMNEARKIRREVIDELKELMNKDFEEIDARQKPYGEWWKLNN